MTTNEAICHIEAFIVGEDEFGEEVSREDASKALLVIEAEIARLESVENRSTMKSLWSEEFKCL